MKLDWTHLAVLAAALYVGVVAQKKGWVAWLPTP